MAACPKCSHAIDQDFGVVVCDKCGVVLFVDYDGQLQISNPNEDAAAEVVAAAEPVAEPEPEAEPDAEPEIVIEAEAPAEPEAVSEPVAEAEWVESSIEDQINSEQIEAAAAAELASKEISFADVESFANDSELDNSPLVYALTISGIDHSETRTKVIDVLRDPKLNFHMKDILPLIKGGRLVLKDLSPIRTHIIVARLREESVDFKWHQGVFQNQEPEESAT